MFLSNSIDMMKNLRKDTFGDEIENILQLLYYTGIAYENLRQISNNSARSKRVGTKKWKNLLQEDFDSI